MGCACMCLPMHSCSCFYPSCHSGSSHSGECHLFQGPLAPRLQEVSMAWNGMAWHGMAWLDMYGVKQHEHGVTWHCMAVHGMAHHGIAWHQTFLQRGRPLHYAWRRHAMPGMGRHGHVACAQRSLHGQPMRTAAHTPSARAPVTHCIQASLYDQHSPAGGNASLSIRSSVYQPAHVSMCSPHCPAGPAPTRWTSLRSSMARRRCKPP